MSNNVSVITIDGPGSSGKGTIGLRLAEDLGWHFLDSGAIYRALAFEALQTKTSLDAETSLTSLASKLILEFRPHPEHGKPAVFIKGVEISEQIRGEECGNAASRISAFPAVRQALLELQHRFRKPPGLVADGRDMGTIVFPDAKIKLFLVASCEERAKRRYQQLKEMGINVSLDALCQELAARDRRDEQRVVAPLKPAPDAIIIDTTGLGINEVLQRVKEKVYPVLGKT